MTGYQIEFLNNCTTGTWKINSEGLVDVDGDFNCRVMNLTDLKGIKFGRISGDFDCFGNQLRTLEGAPREVGGYFDCNNNQLRTLEGAPREVGGYFDCSNNQLQTLEGAPETIGRAFHSDHLRSLTGKWSLVTLASMYSASEGEGKKLLGTLVSPNDLQQRIDAEPEKMAIELKSVVKLPEYQSLVWPENLKGEVNLLADLEVFGL